MLEMIEGTIHICAHNVYYSYLDIESEITEELKERLEQEAVDRAKSQINEGYVQGELNCISGEDEEEIRGWWRIR